MKTQYIIHTNKGDPNKYGLPSLKKYPMPDAKHVRSAIKFFNYVDPKYEKELAVAIFNRMKEYDMSFDDFTVGDDNRFSKYIPRKDELSHHGIDGQKWGQRNGPPYPLDYESHSISEKRENSKSSLSHYPDTEVNKKVKRSASEKKFDKRIEKNEKIWNKIKGKEPSKGEQKLIEKYMNEGMSEKDARISAYNREKLKKIGIAVGAMTVAAAATYVAYNEYEKRADKLLPEDTLIQRIETDSNLKEGFMSGMYAFYEKRDEDAYGYLHAGGFNPSKDNNVYKKTAPITSTSKIASSKSAEKIFREFVEDRENLIAVKDALITFKDGPALGYESIMDSAIRKIDRGKIDKSVYDAFNISMVTASKNDSASKAKSGFLTKIADSGYIGILDENDMKYSGYSPYVKHPFILANSSNIGKSEKANITQDDVIKSSENLGFSLLGRKAAIGAAYVSGILGGVAVSKSMKKTGYNSEEIDIVNEYRKEHPGTKLNNEEILRNYYGYDRETK